MLIGSFEVTKRVGMAPVCGVCIHCGHEYTVPTTRLHSAREATASLQEHLDRHRCAVATSSPKPGQSAQPNNKTKSP